MSGFTVSMKMEIKQLEAALKDVKKRAKKAIRTGVTKAGRILRREIKGRLPKETGLMRKSLAMTVRTYQSGTVVAVVGIRKDAKQQVTLKKVFRFKGLKRVLIREPKTKQMQRNPAKYLHLIELGHTGKDGRHFPGKFPIRRGHEAAKGQMETTIANELKTAMESGTGSK